MADKKVRIGIIGVGNMGTGHYTNIMNGCCPECEITAVADINKDRLDFIANDIKARREHAPETKDVALFSDASEMIKSGLIDAVIVAVPHYDHPRYSIEAMENGLHVMCEKPAGVFVNQVKEMNDCAKRHPELVFGLMFCRRTNPAYIKMKEIVESGEIGEIRRVSWMITNWFRSQRYYDSGSWRATWSGEGGGVLLNQCPHQLDIFQWICGMPSKVHTKMHFGKWHDIEVEDDVTTYLEYPNGATGSFITSTGDAPGTDRFEILGNKGKLVYENFKLTKIILKTPLDEFTFAKEIKGGFGEPGWDAKTVDTSGEETMHIGVMNAFADKILHGGKLIAEGVEGIKSLELSNAMHLSAFLGKPVTLPLDNDLFEKELMKRVATSRRKPESPAVIEVQWANNK